MTGQSSLVLDLGALRELDAQVSSFSAESPDVFRAVADFHEVANTLTERLRQPHTLSLDLGSNLAVTHYTSLEAAFGIISSGPEGFLRLYDSVHLNDPTEGIATPEGEGIRNSLSAIRSFTHPTQSGLGTLAEHYSKAYLVSFVATTDGTDPGDDLDFWRSYGRDGRGCSLTFFPYRSNWPRPAVAGLRSVAYGAPNVPDYRDGTRLLLRIHDAFTTLIGDRSEERDRLASVLPFLDDWFAHRFLTKHSAYRSERELRFVAFPRSGQAPRYALSDGQIRHYLELPDFELGRLFGSPTILRVGPAVPHPEDAADSLRGIWSQYWESMPSIQIMHSRIPYRSQL